MKIQIAKNVSTERLSDNSSYQIFEDNSKITDRRNISIQKKSDNDNLQDTQNVNNVQCLNISHDIYIDVIDEKKNSNWNVSLQTNDYITTYKVDTGAQANVISKHTLACIPKLVVIEPTNVKLSAYNGSRRPVIGSCILNIFTKHKIHSVQFIVIDSNSPSIIGLKTREDLNLLKRLSNININSDIDFYTECANCFGDIESLKHEYKIQLKSNVEPVIHAPRRVPLALKDKLRHELDKMKRLDIMQEVPISGSSEWVNSMVIVEKPNGKLRICLDLSDLNKATKRHHH